MSPERWGAWVNSRHYLKRTNCWLLLQKHENILRKWMSAIVVLGCDTQKTPRDEITQCWGIRLPPPSSYLHNARGFICFLASRFEKAQHRLKLCLRPFPTGTRLFERRIWTGSISQRCGGGFWTAFTDPCTAVSSNKTCQLNKLTITRRVRILIDCYILSCTGTWTCLGDCQKSWRCPYSTSPWDKEGVQVIQTYDQ